MFPDQLVNHKDADHVMIFEEYFIKFQLYNRYNFYSTLSFRSKNQKQREHLRIIVFFIFLIFRLNIYQLDSISRLKEETTDETLYFCSNLKFYGTTDHQN